MSNNLLRQPNFAAIVMLAWLFVTLILLLQYWPRTAETLLDTDDAMRLVELRMWLAGQGWFDLHQARLQPPLGYNTHWSRLIDAGLAGLYAIFKFYLDQASAERLMRAWWPLLWLLPTMAGMTAIAWRMAGREAATVALLLSMAAVPAYQQFMPGRIDHQNVQIALTLLIVAATVWSDRKQWAAAAAGALSGLALAIGLESLPYLAVCGGALSVRYAIDRSAGRALRNYGLALAAATALAFFASVGPANWTRSLCDAIAINSAAAAVVAGLALALTGFMAHRAWSLRIVAIVGACGLALAVFALLEPRCMRGPFVMVDPAIRPIWLDHVREFQPLLAVFRTNPLTAAGIAAFPAAAALAALALARSSDIRDTFSYAITVAAFALAALATCAAIRSFSYAIWLGMPLVAVLALRLFAVLKLKTLTARFVLGLMLTPIGLSSAAIVVADTAGFSDADSFSRPEGKHCTQTASYGGLAQLPPGLVVADTSLGPFLLAMTPHSVMAAPYHRLGNGIVSAHRVLSSPPSEARNILNKIKATYVVVCGDRPPDGLADPARGLSLWGQLRAGAVPAWLEPVPGAQPFTVYRVKY